MRRFAVLGLTVAIGIVGPASAQTIDNAYAFVDQVMLNGATQIYFYGGDKYWMPDGVTSNTCRTVFAVRNGYPARYEINWSKVAEVQELSSNPQERGIVIVGGVSSDTTYPSGVRHENLPKLMILTNAAEMTPRLTKAIGVIRQECASASLGF